MPIWDSIERLQHLLSGVQTTSMIVAVVATILLISNQFIKSRVDNLQKNILNKEKNELVEKLNKANEKTRAVIEYSTQRKWTQEEEIIFKNELKKHPKAGFIDFVVTPVDLEGWVFADQICKIIKKSGFQTGGILEEPSGLPQDGLNYMIVKNLKKQPPITKGLIKAFDATHTQIQLIEKKTHPVNTITIAIGKKLPPKN